MHVSTFQLQIKKKNHRTMSIFDNQTSSMCFEFYFSYDFGVVGVKFQVIILPWWFDEKKP